MLTELQTQFIDFALECNVLQHGDFTLNSGIKSEFFFNFGMFNTGNRLSKLSEFYTTAITEYNLHTDMLFGSAYKGIPLVSSIAIKYSKQYTRDIPFAFNRIKEKDHGEGGLIVGAPLIGTILMLDDVITTGTSINKAIKAINKHSNNIDIIVLVAIDRSETINMINIPVYSIVTINDIRSYMIS